MSTTFSSSTAPLPRDGATFTLNFPKGHVIGWYHYLILASWRQVTNPENKEARNFHRNWQIVTTSLVMSSWQQTVKNSAPSNVAPSASMAFSNCFTLSRHIQRVHIHVLAIPVLQLNLQMASQRLKTSVYTEWVVWAAKAAFKVSETMLIARQTYK